MSGDHRVSLPVIAIDIGNSAVKAARYASPDAFDSSPPIARLTIDETDFARQLTFPVDEAAQWWIASVRRPAAERLSNWLTVARPQDFLRFVTIHDLPLQVDVRFPDRVGIDRLLSATAVNRMRDPGRAAVIVDAGSAVTVDAVDAFGTFLGGAILPGPSLMAKALSVHTDQLPLISAATLRPPPTIGKATEEAIAAGIYWSLVGAIRELVARTSRSLERTPQFFLTGGDAPWLVQHLPAKFRHVPDLVLRGLLVAAQHAGRLP